MSTNTDSEANQKDNEPSGKQKVESGENPGLRRPGDRFDGFADKRVKCVANEVSEE